MAELQKPTDAEIEASHPVNSGRHDAYLMAMELVGPRHEKYSIVALVSHLLLKAERSTGSGAVEKPGWRDFESAPKDGTVIYVWVPGNWNGRGNVVRTAWHGFWMNEFLNGGAAPGFNPTHWQAFEPPAMIAATPSTEARPSGDALVEELNVAIEAAHDVALNAVDHVGVANYASREREARTWIDEAFDKLRAAARALQAKE